MRNSGKVLLAVLNLCVMIFNQNGVYHFDFFKFNNDLNFILSEMSFKCTEK
jgi:hypothetical protein